MAMIVADWIGDSFDVGYYGLGLVFNDTVVGVWDFVVDNFDIGTAHYFVVFVVTVVSLITYIWIFCWRNPNERLRKVQFLALPQEHK